MNKARRPDLLGMIRELTEPTTHRELYFRKRKPRYHVTHNPPLLDQLDQSSMPSYTQSDSSGGTAGSRPTANVDALDAANQIRTEAATWLRHLGLTDHGTTVELVRRLTTHALTDRDLARDIRRWWTWARITTGWDTPAWKPDNTCPTCANRGTLRIRILDTTTQDMLATCIDTNCRATWEPAAIPALANHIRTENGDTIAS